MNVKEFTHVKYNGQIIFKYEKFVALRKISSIIRARKILGKIDIEYHYKIENESFPYALYFLRDGIIKGGLFLCASRQNKKKLS